MGNWYDNPPDLLPMFQDDDEDELANFGIKTNFGTKTLQSRNLEMISQNLEMEQLVVDMRSTPNLDFVDITSDIKIRSRYTIGYECQPCNPGFPVLG